MPLKKKMLFTPQKNDEKLPLYWIIVILSHLKSLNNFKIHLRTSYIFDCSMAPVSRKYIISYYYFYLKKKGLLIIIMIIILIVLIADWIFLFI